MVVDVGRRWLLVAANARQSHPSSLLGRQCLIIFGRYWSQLVATSRQWSSVWMVLTLVAAGCWLSLMLAKSSQLHSLEGSVDYIWSLLVAAGRH